MSGQKTPDTRISKFISSNKKRIHQNKKDKHRQKNTKKISIVIHRRSPDDQVKARRDKRIITIRDKEKAFCDNITERRTHITVHKITKERQNTHTHPQRTGKDEMREGLANFSQYVRYFFTRVRV